MSRAVRRVTAIAVITVIAAGLGLVLAAGPLRQSELRTYDYRFRLRPEAASPAAVPITIVAIDDSSFEHLTEPLMLWQRHFADAIRGVVSGGAAAIGIDFLFADVDAIAPAATQALNESLIAAGTAGVPVVLAYRVRGQGVEQPPPSIQMAATAAGHVFGFVNLTTDADDFIRRQLLEAASTSGEVQPSFALALARAVRAKSGPSVTPEAREILINFRSREAFPRVPLTEVLDAFRRKDTGYLKRTFEGRTVLLGMAAGRGSEDMHSTPQYFASESEADGRKTPGVVVHANAAATILANDAIREAGWTSQALLTTATAVLFAIVWTYLPAVRAAALSLAGLAGLGFTAVWFFGNGVWIGVVAPLVAGLSAIGFTEGANYWFEGRERRRITDLFGRFVSDAVITELMNLPEGEVLRARRQDVAVLFADIRDFTSRSERAAPEHTVNLLNTYFAEIVPVIQAHGGTVNCLMGDGIMATFGAPLADPDAAFHAVEAGREMMAAVARVNAGLAAGEEPIRIGIGINAGDAVVGCMGAPRMLEYSSIGDIVNTASRVEGKTKEVGHPILITQAVFDRLAGRVPTGPPCAVEVKGREAAVTVHPVLPL